MNKDIIFFGETNFRGERKKFGIKFDDRRRHIYIIGKTGMGKTELLKNMAIQDIKNGNGLGFIDPHGEASEELLKFVPEERIEDVIYFNPSDIEKPIAFNIMEEVDPDYRHLIAGGLMGVFKKIWPDVWSSRMEYILNNAVLALLEIKGSTLLGINRLLSDAEWRKEVLEDVHDPVVKAFWTKEFSRYSQRYETEATAAIQNKIGQFISSPLIRNIVGHCSENIEEISKEVGREIARNGHILVTGATTGVPYFASVGCNELGGFNIGFSPAATESQHLKSYRLPLDPFNIMIYTGADYVGRDVIMTKSADAVIIICGRTGTLHEFTVAIETNKIVAVLEGTGGMADKIRGIIESYCKASNKIIYERDPKKLVERVIKEIDKKKKKASKLLK
jgi:uncharacterized protein (TIGR00725 family)